MLTCFGMISYVAIELALAHLIVTVMLRLLISSKTVLVTVTYWESR